MMNKLASQPIILRREPFGGIVFDPFDGTMLELDHDGYAVAQKVLSGWGWFFDSQKRAFARDLKASLYQHRLRDVYEVPTMPAATATSVPTFSAPTLVDFQITSQCNMGCPHCYASAITGGEHVAWEDLELVVNQLSDCGVCQLAIGGGEPLLHPQIIDLLKLCDEKHIVPNLTTGGNEFDDAKLAALKKYCGAVGMSLEGVGERYDRWRGQWGFDNFQRSIAQMKEAEIPTVLQITLSGQNFYELDEIVDFCLSQEHLYGVIFLAYKNVGRGTHAAAGLGAIDPTTVSLGLKKAFDRLAPQMRVGYDCCMTPGVAGVEDRHSFVDLSNLEGCSATRGSVGISTNLDVIPCTFTWGYPLGNLREHHLRDIWTGQASEDFRGRIQRKVETNSTCSGCSKRSHCMGGCPVMPLINCHNNHIPGYDFPGPRTRRPIHGLTREPQAN